MESYALLETIVLAGLDVGLNKLTRVYLLHGAQPVSETMKSYTYGMTFVNTITNISKLDTSLGPFHVELAMKLRNFSDYLMDYVFQANVLNRIMFVSSVCSSPHSIYITYLYDTTTSFKSDDTHYTNTHIIRLTGGTNSEYATTCTCTPRQ